MDEQSGNQRMNQSMNLDRVNKKKEGKLTKQNRRWDLFYLSIWDLAVDGSPISKTLMSLQKAKM